MLLLWVLLLKASLKQIWTALAKSYEGWGWRRSAPFAIYSGKQRKWLHLWNSALTWRLISPSHAIQGSSGTVATNSAERKVLPVFSVQRDKVSLAHFVCGSKHIQVSELNPCMFQNKITTGAQTWRNKWGHRWWPWPWRNQVLTYI